MRRSLVVNESDTQLAQHAGRFEVRIAGNLARRVRTSEIDQIVLLGEVSITPEALTLALRNHIDIALLTPTGRYRGRVTSDRGARADLALAQYRLVSDEPRRRAVAAAIVDGKIRNQRRLLVRYQRGLRDDSLAGVLTGMRRMSQRCLEGDSLDQVRGFEGQAAALYWKGFAITLGDSDLTFSGRTFRPPLDPVNACLSFAYSLLATTCDSIVRVVGLEPGLGFLHEVDRGARPSVALDLMEEFRPIVVDQTVLSLANRRQLTVADFETPGADAIAASESDEVDEQSEASTPRHPVHLTVSGRKVLLHALYARLREGIQYPAQGTVHSLRDIIELQARHLARHVLGEDERYVPFVPR